jgi:hypothetical protein
VKVDKNAPTFGGTETMGQTISQHSRSNIPIRLEIAARILASIAAPVVQSAGEYESGSTARSLNRMPDVALHLADRLIEAHNSTQKADE